MVYLPLVLVPTLSFLLIFTQYYRTGAYFLDTGWFSHSFCSSWGENTPGNTLFWGNNSIFGLHTFFTPTLSCRIVDSIVKNPNISYSILLAFGNFLAGLLGYLLTRKFFNRQLSVLSGILLSLSSFAMGSITYPHPEAIGGVLAGFGIYWLVHEKSGSWIFFLLAILTREDLGIHIGIVSICSVLLVNDLPKKLRKSFLILGAVSIVSTGLLKIFQIAIFPTTESVFSRTYLGSPPFAILRDPQELIMRISYWIQNNPGILGFYLIMYLLSKASRSKVFLVPVIASLPWVALNLIAVDPAKQILQLYHSFPFLVYISIICLPLQFSSKKDEFSPLVKKMVLGLFAWIAVYGSLAGGQVGSAGSINFGLHNTSNALSGYRYIEKHSKALEHFLWVNPAVRVDSGVASLFPSFDSRMFDSASDLTAAKVILYFPLYSLNGSSIDSFKNSPGVKTTYCSSESPLVLRIHKSAEVIDMQQLGLKLCK